MSAKFIPFAGNNTIKSFWITQNCVTIHQFLKFVENDGYKNKKYWSKEGHIWLNHFKYNHPKNWKKIDEEWYLGNEELKYFYNHLFLSYHFMKQKLVLNIMVMITYSRRMGLGFYK